MYRPKYPEDVGCRVGSDFISDSTVAVFGWQKERLPWKESGGGGQRRCVVFCWRKDSPAMQVIFKGSVSKGKRHVAESEQGGGS